MDIITLLKANLKNRKGVFIGTLALVFVVCVSLCTMFSFISGYEKSIVAAQDYARVGDIISMYNNKNFTGEIQSELDNTEAIEEYKLNDVYFVNLQINGSSFISNADTALYSSEATYGQFRIYNEDKTGFLDKEISLNKGEILLPVVYADIFNLKVGDKITTNLFAEDKLTVAGFIEDPLYGGSMMGIKRVVVADYEYSTLSQNENAIGGKLVHLYRADKSQSVSAFKRQIGKETSITSTAFISMTREQSQYYLMILPKTMGSIMMGFALILFAIVIIILGHSISTGIELDYVNLGILKSQGFTKERLRMVLLWQYLAAVAVGGVLGFAASFPLSAFLSRQFLSITGIISNGEIDLGVSFAFIFAIILISAAFLLIKTKKIAAISPVKAISGGLESVYFKSRLNASIGKGFLNFRLALRQITSQKRRYGGLLLIGAVMTAFLIITMDVTSIINQTMSSDNSNLMALYGGTYYDFNISQNSDDFSEVEAEIENISPIKKSYYLGGRYMVVDGDEIYAQITDTPDIFESLYKGRLPLYDNEIVITELVANQLEKKIGDTVLITLGDKKAEFIITGYYQSMNDVGITIMMNTDGFEKLYDTPNYMTTKRYVIEDSEKTDEILSALDDKFDDTIEYKKYNSDNSQEKMITQVTDITVVSIYLIAVIFIIVSSAMICMRTFLQERADIGILRALGFTVRRLRLQFALRFGTLALISGVLGLGLYAICGNWAIGLVMGMVGFAKIYTEPTAATFLIPIATVTLCFFTFSYLASGKVKRANVRELNVD